MPKYVDIVISEEQMHKLKMTKKEKEYCAIGIKESWNITLTTTENRRKALAIKQEKMKQI